MQANRMVRLALLVAGAAALHAVEGAMPNPLIVTLGPGGKLGLANVVTVAVVMRYGLRDALVVAVLRALLGSLLGGTFLTMGFFLSLSGAVVSAAGMGLAYLIFGSRLSAVGLSLLGALLHNLAQLTVASLLARHFGLFVHLPYLMLMAIPTGYFVGVIGALLGRYLAQSNMRKGGPREV
jgi:heptaprenyl diphosphate synthase